MIMHMTLRLLTLLFVVASLLGNPAPLQAQAGAPPSTRDVDRSRDQSRRVESDVALTRGNRAEYVVAGPSGSSALALSALQTAGASLLSSRDLAILDRRVMVLDLGRRLDLDAASQILAEVSPSQRVDFNHLYRFAQGTPRLYAPAMIGDPAAGACRLSTTQKVGLIDGDVDVNHPALSQSDIILQTALIPGQELSDRQHGTAVAALLVGEDIAGGLAGFAAGSRLFAISAFAAEQGGAAADVERIGASLSWLLANNVKLINMSFAGPPNIVLEDLLVQAERQGAIMIAAAGNDGRHIAQWPSAAPSVIAVTAVDAAMQRYRAANWGAHIEFAAPGVDIYVARRTGGGYATGTSYAAPIVTALAARLGASSLGNLRNALRIRSRDLGEPGRDAEFGWGLVQNIGC